MNKLGNFIKESREERGLSLRDFASLCDLSHSYVDSIEKGKDPRSGKPVSPTVESLIKIAKGLNVSALDLFKYVYDDNLEINRENKLPIPDDPKYKGYSATLTEEFARRGLSPEAQRELLEAGIHAVEEARKRYNKPRK